MKKHDENKDLSLFCRIGKVDYSNKSLKLSKTTIVGNRTWGRIDFLTHYCGWTLIYDNSIKIVKNVDKEATKEKIKNVTNARKASKEHTLTNKTKKNNNNKQKEL